MRAHSLLAGAALLASGACIPYSTGTTAVPVPQGDLVPQSAIYFVPGGMENFAGDSASGLSIIGMDVELRYGIDDRSDLGVRFPGLSGVVVNYKRRLDSGSAEETALAALLGAGVVNAGEHFEFEASIIASAPPRNRLTPYGGVKSIFVVPAVEGAASDEPTIGVFAGVRIGTEGLGLSPEIALFHDRSALGLREGSWIIVPSFTFHGSQLFDLLLGRGGPRHTPVPRPPRRPYP